MRSQSVAQAGLELTNDNLPASASRGLGFHEYSTSGYKDILGCTGVIR